jgi:hypothetical protein
MKREFKYSGRAVLSLITHVLSYFELGLFRVVEKSLSGFATEFSGANLLAQ